MPTEETAERVPGWEPKYIFVTGGVMSGLGKGITAASLGRLLTDAGFVVTAVKIDPYLNVDAGTMNPYEHGEVYVLDDGGEVDLDFGAYERFLETNIPFSHNITTGKVYEHVIEKEREGEFLGDTVQVVPHITDEIKRRIKDAADGTDICLVEVGGTVGDIEGMPFLEALRQFKQEMGEKALFAHVTLLPYSMNGEQKTKPTQHSVKSLRSVGLDPDCLVGRCKDHLTSATREKIALNCDVDVGAVFSNPDTEDIHTVPEILQEEEMDRWVIESLGLEDAAIPEAKRGRTWHKAMRTNRDDEITLALAGKYDLEDAYMSVHEAIEHASAKVGVEAEVKWVDTEKMSSKHHQILGDADGIIVPGGFGERGIEGKIEVARFARTAQIPYLGLCLGFQIAVIEHARNVMGLEDAHSTEFDEDTSKPVIDLLPEQYDVEDLGGTMRLGSYPADIDDESLAADLWGSTASGRHRHRYEVNPEYIDELEEDNLTFSGTSNHRMEILERTDHPYFVGTQFHPEFNSRPTRPEPAFTGLVAAAAGQLEEQLHKEADPSI